jgi:branched-subunit amino acid ABC-type transport system permease component
MVAAVIGGEAIHRAILGALLLAGLETLLGFWLPGNWKATVAFGVLIAVLVARGGSLAQVVRRRI